MPQPLGTVEVCPDPAALARRAADEFCTACAAALARAGRFATALSGGRTPRAMLEALASRAIDWPRVHFFWSDERCVPPDDAASNYRMAADALLSRVDVPASNVHRMKGELAPAAGASDYAAELERFFGSSVTAFDLLFLGLGADGHTASLFPGSPALADRSGSPAIGAPAPPGTPSPWRLTLSYASINAARRIAFLVEGSEKADVLARVVEGPRELAMLPAQGVAPIDGDLLWLVDAAAAAKLKSARSA
jgi:6-phosphogluconolactonase